MARARSRKSGSRAKRPAAKGPAQRPATRFEKVLVANRGEIALRVIRGAKKLGYRTVAVYSDADREAQHVLEADQAVNIGPAPPKESYLSIERIVAAAKSSGAEAVHPGYGFLSENEDFAAAVQAAGLVFIGPDPHSIEAMGNKSAAKERMIAARVPCVPGYQGEAQDDATLVREAKRIGLPVMVKAAAGGGGRGMRLVPEERELAGAIRSARSEAESAFGDAQLLIEKAVVDGRHVEIQVFGDRHGNVIALGERDCSVQRRNQKVLEEAPSPAVDDALRGRMCAAAVAAAKAVGYVGAGTVEFLLDRSGKFYFMEMNTRLQVEHPVTELVYGVDLVEWQLRIAQGERLPMTQDEVLARRGGWAIEARLCAEDPLENYLPQTGTVLQWRAPHGAGVRVDTYLRDGTVVSPFYDSLQAKIIAWGEDRETARQRLLKALEDTTLLGVISNRDFLHALASHEAFAGGDFGTGFIPRHFPAGRTAALRPSPRQVALAAVALYMDDALGLAAEHGFTPDFIGWHSSHEAPADFRLQWRDQAYALEMMVHEGREFSTTVAGEEVALTVTRAGAGEMHYRCAGVQHKARIAHQEDSVWVQAEGGTWRFTDLTYAPAQAAAAGADGRIVANSDGKIVAVHVRPGEAVKKGQTLVVLEAMKMEFQLVTPVDGTVESVSAEAGIQVKARQLLVHVTPSGGGAPGA